MHATEKHVFQLTGNGTIILSPIPEKYFAADPELVIGSVRFKVRFPAWVGDGNVLSQRIKEVLPDFKVDIEPKTSGKTYGENSFTIVIRNRVEAPWGYPDFQMEALNKLEQLIQWPFMSEIKVDAIQWPSLEGNQTVVARCSAEFSHV
ncbi:unnamed protein product [Dicrocoelium dendriticum]|nr:unnamed protein product [Dicrocoelium dendriticum]